MIDGSTKKFPCWLLAIEYTRAALIPFTSCTSCRESEPYNDIDICPKLTPMPRGGGKEVTVPVVDIMVYVQVSVLDGDHSEKGQLWSQIVVKKWLG